jgi:hypothetical protein
VQRIGPGPVRCSCRRPRLSCHPTCAAPPTCDALSALSPCGMASSRWRTPLLPFALLCSFAAALLFSPPHKREVIIAPPPSHRPLRCSCVSILLELVRTQATSPSVAEEKVIIRSNWCRAPPASAFHDRPPGKPSMPHCSPEPRAPHQPGQHRQWPLPWPLTIIRHRLSSATMEMPRLVSSPFTRLLNWVLYHTDVLWLTSPPLLDAGSPGFWPTPPPCTMTPAPSPVSFRGRKPSRVGPGQRGLKGIVSLIYFLWFKFKSNSSSNSLKFFLI